MSAVALFASTFLVVFFLSLQTINVSRGYYLGAFLTSFGIGLSNLVMLKTVPDATGVELIAFLCGGPFGVVTAMRTHQPLMRLMGRVLGREERPAPPIAGQVVPSAEPPHNGKD